MTPRCTQPELAMDILEATRAESALGPRLSRHLAACKACQTATERLRRMQAVWAFERADDPPSASAAALFARQSGPRRPSSFREPLSLVAFGMAVGAVVLVLTGLPESSRPRSGAAPDRVATNVPELAEVGENRPSARSVPEPQAAQPSAPSSKVPVAQVEGPRGVIEIAEGVRVELKAGESAQVTLAEGLASELHGPCLVEFRASPAEVGGWRMAFLPIASPVVPLEVPAEPLSPAAAPPTAAPRAEAAPVLGLAADAPADPGSHRAWTRAAEALRRDDFAAADLAFSELGFAPDAATRDAARLAQAQLWMAHGRGVAARPVLEDLARSGATALVRERAAEFLVRDIH